MEKKVVNHIRVWLAFLVSFLLCLRFLLSWSQKHYLPSLFDFSTTNYTTTAQVFTRIGFDDQEEEEEEDLLDCHGRYIYIHHLPSRFNDDLLQDCRSLNKWFDICPRLVNRGFGPLIQNYSPDDVWYATNQFLLEIIFRNRMNNYACLTNDSSSASAIYVPFYAGLDIGRHLWGYNITLRDSLGIDLAEWLADREEWKKMNGRDHFFISGRIGWDFHRRTNNESDWGSLLMKLPEFMNMTMLSIETTSWSNEFGIPYPTYFHPSNAHQLVQWQKKMRNLQRPFLFSFVGAPRQENKESIRSEIINQCLASTNKSCNLFLCNDDSGSKNCEDPRDVMNVFQHSVFCLQPPGDSYTRRSIFDSILGGCIPVLFHPGSAYAQYLWHLPKNYSKYSVFIAEHDIRDGKVRINETLMGFSEKQVTDMRNEVIRLIPSIVYSSRELEKMEDAFDIAVKGVLGRVENVRRKGIVGFAQENSWISKLSGIGRDHQWDHLF